MRIISLRYGPPPLYISHKFIRAVFLQQCCESNIFLTNFCDEKSWRTVFIRIFQGTYYRDRYGGDREDADDDEEEEKLDEFIVDDDEEVTESEGSKHFII